MANARASALAERRGTQKIRILAPASTGISSIAKQNAANETDIMIAKYNAGQIGNAEMKAFLQTQLASQYVSASDKVQIQTKLLDFDSLIEKDRLEAAFKLAPENSLQKAQAATALADFYTKRASTMVAGTQAHSQALENAGAWQQQVANIRESTNKEQQKNYKNQMLATVNSIPSGSGRAQASAEMYGKLYDLAMSQGDQESAQVYEANRQQQLSYVQAYQESEANQASKEERGKNVDALGQLKNLYHDGSITAEQYYEKLQEIDAYALNTGDVVLQNAVNAAADYVAKKEAAGGLNRGTVGGLPVVLKGSGSGGGGSVTSWDMENFKLDEAMRQAQEFLKVGQTPDEQPFTADDYYQTIVSVITAKDTLIDERIAAVQAEAAGNPGKIIKFNGRNTRADAILDALNKEKADIGPQQDAIASGKFALKVVPPKQSATNPTGSQVATVEPISTDNINSDTTRMDTSGFVYDIVKEMTPMSDAEIAKIYMNQIPDETSATGYRKVKEIAPGVWEKETGKTMINTPEIGGTRKITLEDTEEPFGPWSKESDLFETNKAQGEVRVEGPEAIAMQKKAKTIQAQQTALPQVPAVNLQSVKTVFPEGVKSSTPQPAMPTAIQSIAPPKPVSVSPNMPGLSTPQSTQSSSQGLTYNTPTPPKVTYTAPKAVTPPSPSQPNSGLTYNYVPPKVTAPTVYPNTIKVNNTTKVKQYDVKTGKYIYI